MSAPWSHIHVSERELAHTWPDGQKDDGKWEDCLWCSVVEWLNDTWQDVPDTLAYAEALRDASGEPPTGGSNFTNVQKAFTVLRIPIMLEPKFFPTFWSRLAPGTGGVANGSMGNFASGHRLRRHDPGFAGGHSVDVSRVDGTDRVWWCDPLAPKGTYSGEWVTKAELAKFMGTSWMGVTRHLRARPATPTGGDMPALVTYIPGYTANVKPQSNVRAAPAGTAAKFRTTTDVKEPVVLTGTVTGTVDPANGSNVWYTWWKNGRWEYTAKDNVVDIKAASPLVPGPDLTPFSQAQMDAAKATARAEGEVAGKLAGAAAERSKIQAGVDAFKALLGL